MNKDDVIERLGLTPLGFEGGYYKETFRQPGSVETAAGSRAPSTAIYYLLTPTTCSLMHRLRGPEVYHFYLGDSVEMLMLHPDETRIVRLGPDILSGDAVQHVVPGGVWQGSRLLDGGSFALMGTTMSPGFDLADFTLGDRDDLVAEYPAHADRIARLTAELVKTKRLELAAAGLDLLHAAERGAAVIGAGLRAEVPESIAAFVRRPVAGAPTPRYATTWYVVDRDQRRAIGAAIVDDDLSVVVCFDDTSVAEEAVAALVDHLFARSTASVVTIGSEQTDIRAALRALGFRDVDERLVLERRDRVR